MSGNSEQKQSWAEAVIECVSDSAERERLIRMYDYDELVTACLALGTLALTAKHESARNKQLEEELAAARSETARPLTKGELEALIDYHDFNDAGADAMGMVESAEYHNQQSKHFKALRDKLEAK